MWAEEILCEIDGGQIYIRIVELTQKTLKIKTYYTVHPTTLPVSKYPNYSILPLQILGFSWLVSYVAVLYHKINTFLIQALEAGAIQEKRRRDRSIV